MLSLDEIKTRIEQNVPGARVEIVPNPSVLVQSSLLLDNEHALAVAEFLRDDADLRFDYASNATGVDWSDRIEKVKTKVKKLVDGAEKEVEETTDRQVPSYLEAVYHLYSMQV